MSTLLFVEILRERDVQAQWFDVRKGCRSIRPALFKLVRDFCLLFACSVSSERRAAGLRPAQLLAVGGMLFSMFFGAGNLILPPLLGLQAGDAAIPAMAGFLAAGIGLPVLGIVAVAVCGGVRELAGRVSPLFASV